jgi:hypothetical protein
MTALHFNDWLTELKALFPVAEEYELAAAIYSFQAAWCDGLSPKQAYDDFDRWCSCEDAA